MPYSATGDPGRATLEELFRLLVGRKYRGSVTIHFDNGRPLVAEYGRPSQMELIPKLNGAAAASANSNAGTHAVMPEVELQVVRGPTFIDPIKS